MTEIMLAGDGGDYADKIRRAEIAICSADYDITLEEAKMALAIGPVAVTSTCGGYPTRRLTSPDSTIRLAESWLKNSNGIQLGD